MECVRIITENNEKQMLSQYATLSANTQGRKREEEKWQMIKNQILEKNLE